MIKKNPPHKHLYKQRRSTCKKSFKKVFKFNQIIFIIQYRDVLIPSTPGMQFKISILKIHHTEKIINYTTGFLSLCKVKNIPLCKVMRMR